MRDNLAELREFIAARPTEARIWLATAWVCVSLLIVTPTLWPWAIFADVCAAAMGLSAYAWLLRRQRDSARAEVHEMNAENTRLHFLLTEAELCAPVPFVPTDGPHLRVVPEQRDPEHDHLPLSREEWDAILHETRDYQ